MEYKIYNCSLQISKPPYNLKEAEKDINLFKKFWKTNDVEWRYIGSVSSLGIARKMVEYNKMYYSENGIIYSLECDPSDEFFCEFVKIEYGNNVEYYDDYCNHNNSKIFKRRFV